MTGFHITLLITAFREAATIGLALDKILPQLQNLDAEVLVICPDDETAQIAAAHSPVHVLRDPAAGKPAALNLGFEAASGDIIIMTDGDVVIGQNAIPELLEPFQDSLVGAVTGRPVSTSPRNTMLGYWSHLLTDAGAHMERKMRDQKGEFMVCSGYLYAIRAGLVESIPEDALAEDAVISHRIAEKGYRICYAPDAVVSVRYPTTYRDWLNQRVRSAGGYVQPYVARSRFQMRSFRYEIAAGTVRALHYARNLRELWWTLLLMLARLHLWLLIFWRVRLLRMPLTRLWMRIETTK